MKVLKRGHRYSLSHIDGKGESIIDFLNREEEPHEGPLTQEVIRALIDRTRHCDECLRWEGNDQIIKNVQMALVLHECRAMLRKVEKGELHPEFVKLGTDGHYLFTPQVPPKGAYLPREFSDSPVLREDD